MFSSYRFSKLLPLVLSFSKHFFWGLLLSGRRCHRPLFLTDDGVDALGRVLPEGADAGALGGHREAGERPLAVHVLTDHGPHLPDPRQPAEQQRRASGGHRSSRKRAVGGAYAERRFSLVSFRAKMWTVPLSLEAHRKDESWLKLMLEGKETFRKNLMAPPLGEGLQPETRALTTGGRTNRGWRGRSLCAAPPACLWCWCRRAG